MRKIFTFILAMLLISLTASAQDNQYKNEFRLSVSDGIPLSITSAVGNIFASAFTGRKIVDSGNSVHWSAGYRNHISPRIAVGGDISFQSIYYDLEYKSGDTGSERMNFYSIMPALDVTYYQSRNVKLYGSAMAGVGFVGFSSSMGNDDGSSSGTAVFSFQVNPIGIRVGRQVAGFAELGAGLKGIVTLGVSAAF